MTGTDIIEEYKLLLQEDRSTLVSIQPQLYFRHCQRAADEIARRTWALYYQVTTDIVNGQFEYCLPFPPYELRAVTVTDSGGAVWPIAAIKPEDMDDNYWQWRSDELNMTGIPEFYVVEGLNLFKLYPVPDYSRADALMFEGYFTVSGFWADPADECPLPALMHETVVLGAALRRCRELIHIPEYAQRMPVYRADFEESVRQMYRISMNSNEARRMAGPPSRGKRLGAWSLWGWGL